MTNKLKVIVFTIVTVITLAKCKDELRYEKYEKPDWLAGKIYTQMKTEPDISTFTSCVEKIGLDSILDVSGSYTVFASTNDAWSSYLEKNGYASIDDIPTDKLARIIKYSIIQNAWSKIQLRTLDVYGWIDTMDINNNKARGNKRVTLLLEENVKYGVKSYKPVGESIDINKERVAIVDTTKSNWTRKAITDSRKYAPVFYKEYFDIYHLKSSDYSFYFDRTFDGGNNIYYAGSKIISDEIFAENGFIYKVDRVVEPLNNALEMISSVDNEKKYSLFLQLLNLFPEFKYNEQKTLEQPGADEGLLVDSLFNLTYPSLTFNLNLEKTKAPSGTFGLPPDVTVRYQYGLMAPTNIAFNTFLDDYIRIDIGWGRLIDLPDRIKRMIVNSYLSENVVYPSDYESGFYNGEKDLVKLNTNDITDKRYGSNCSFIGLNNAIIPRAFKSITGPAYLLEGYNKVMNGIEESGLLAALKKPNKDYVFFIEPDNETDQDSSFFYDSYSNNPDRKFYLFSGDLGHRKKEYISVNDLRTLFLNQVAIKNPTGIPNKEFIPNLAGNYIIFNNITGEVSGTASTTEGFSGGENTPEFPEFLDINTDNGKTYKVKNWFSFSTISLFVTISSKYVKFYNLLKKAGLATDYELTFISKSDFCTAFIPSDDALNNAGVDDMPIDELKSFLQFHFIQGLLIFTDGSSPSKYYETYRVDEKSTEYNKVFTKVYIHTNIDKIILPDESDNDYINVVDILDHTNQLTVYSTAKSGDFNLFPMVYNNAVIHEVDKVFDINIMKIH